MNTIERIFNLIDEKRINANKLEIVTGLTNGTISSWKRDIAKPSVNALSKIADYFNVSVDYLIGRTDKETISTINQGIIGNQNQNNTITINGNEPRTLSEMEIEIIRICTNFDTRKKNALLAYAYELEKK